MSYDVSIYYSRVKTAYYDSVEGGSSVASGASPYSSATGGGGGGSVSGVVRTTGDQIASGIKIWDSSAIFNNDVSILGGLDASSWATFGMDVSIKGDLYVEGDINGGDLTLVNLHVTNDVSIDGNLYLNGNLLGFTLGELNDVSVSGVTLNQVLSWDGTYWVPADSSTAGSATYTYVDGSLNERDVSIAWLVGYNDEQDTSIAWLRTYMYTKAEVDDMFVPRDASIIRIDGSLNSLFNKNVSQDASIVSLRATNTSQDASIVVIRARLDASLITDLNGLQDVNITSLNDNDFLLFNTDTSKWENQPSEELIEFGSKDSSATGLPGQMAYDASYFYLCTSTNVWMRFLGENNY